MPLDPKAVKKANQELWANHPELNGRQLTAEEKDGPLGNEWNKAYRDAAKQSPAPPKPTTKPEPSPTPQPVPANNPALACDGKPDSPPKKPKEEKNWIDLKYTYSDGKGVAGARYTVTDLDTGAEYSGVLDSNGFAHQDLPLSVVRVKYRFHDDPSEVETLVEPIPNQQAASGWFDRMVQGGKDATDWVWGAVQGDYNEDPSVGQIAFNTALTLIPIVDQVGDVRDLSANLKALIVDKRFDEKMVWLGTALTLVGCVPEVGSAVKGVLKAVAKGARLDRLLRIFNYFYKSNGPKWLRKLLSEIPQHASFVKGKLASLLNDLDSKLSELLKMFPGSKSIADYHAALKAVKEKAAQKVDEIFEELRQKLSKALDEPLESSRPGSVKSTNKHVQAMEPRIDNAREYETRKNMRQNINKERKLYPENEKKAMEFYRKNGITGPEVEGASGAYQIKKTRDDYSHLQGVDLSKPVTDTHLGAIKTDVNENGKKIIYTWQDPDDLSDSNKVGQYFTADKNTTPDQLGIMDTTKTGKKKVLVAYEVADENAPVLESTAAGVVPWWDGTSSRTNGGGTQLAVPRRTPPAVKRVGVVSQ